MRPRFRLPTTSGFGLVYSIVLLLVSVPTVIIYSAVWGLYSHSQGFEVHTMFPKSAGPAFENPLIVTVWNCTNCVRSKLYLNGAPITWEELPVVLRAELSRRAERVVYVESDDSVNFAEVAMVIDSTAQAWRGASIILLTPVLKKIQRGDQRFQDKWR